MKSPRAVHAAPNAHQDEIVVPAQTEHPAKDYISELHPDCIHLIARFLSLGDLASLRAVSQRFATVLRGQALERLSASIKIRDVVPLEGGCFYIPDGEGLFVWGDNESGQLGLGHMDEVLVPTRVTALDGHEIQKLKLLDEGHCGRYFYCLTNRGLYIWSADGRGRLGLECEDKAPLEPVRFAALIGLEIQQLKLSEFSVYCVTDQGVFVWGDNESGQLGLGHTNEVLVPTSLGALAGYKIQQLKFDDGGSVYCVTDQGVFVWGDNSVGQLGLGHKNNVGVPTRLGTLAGHKIQQLKLSEFSVYCVTNEDLFVWGSNRGGQLGLEHMDEVLVPTRVTALDGLKIRQLKFYGGSVFCVTNQGVFVWGENEKGELYLGHRNNVLTPHLVTIDPAKSRSIALLETQTCQGRSHGPNTSGLFTSSSTTEDGDDQIVKRQRLSY